ncbi:prefoldin subunit 6 [Fopius arisanus]|uniref:Probable prefoldin subunit 6 n=1 Tax=Fopius arisanus TaxID=64838 RepID=A0A0C9S097_9HYME|nr:PREDICTED: prefoldin subunit 6 [Fopius arisanus]XP_011304376.1 PREDICTED: prefoldin subunit 6 [Fopius arisanus]
MEELQKKMQSEVDAYKQLQRDYHKALISRQQLDGQLNENSTVKEELSLLKPGNEVFKLIGPVLIKQDLEEARQNVNKRIEFITNELKRTETLIADLDSKQEKHRETLDKLQQMFQQAHQKSALKA